MALSKRELGTGESVIIHTRTHWKALIGPFLAFVLICLLAGVAIGFGTPRTPPEYHTWVNVGIGVVALVLMLTITAKRFLRWLTTTYTLTNRRLITRRGILNQIGHDLPLIRINNVEYERSLSDRILGCGTLVLTTAADDPIVLPDLPGITNLHRQLSELMLTGDVERYADN